MFTGGPGYAFAIRIPKGSLTFSLFFKAKDTCKAKGTSHIFIMNWQTIHFLLKWFISFPDTYDIIEEYVKETTSMYSHAEKRTDLHVIM